MVLEHGNVQVLFNYSDCPNIWFIQYLVEQTENGYKLFQINSVAFFHLTIVNVI